MSLSLSLREWDAGVGWLIPLIVRRKSFAKFPNMRVAVKMKSASIFKHLFIHLQLTCMSTLKAWKPTQSCDTIAILWCFRNKQDNNWNIEMNHWNKSWLLSKWSTQLLLLVIIKRPIAVREAEKLWARIIFKVIQRKSVTEPSEFFGPEK